MTLSPNDAPVLELEDYVDTAWAQTWLPGTTYEESVLYLLLAAEDKQRIRLAAGKNMDAWSATLGQVPFELRQLLDLAARRFKGKRGTIPDRIEMDVVGASLPSFDVAHAYQVAIAGFSGHHVGRGRWTRVEGEQRLVIARDGEDFSSLVLDRLLGTLEPAPHAVLWLWLHGEKPNHANGVGVLSMIDAVAGSDGEAVWFAYVPAAAKLIAAALPPSRTLVPTDSQSKAGDGATVCAILDALRTRCAYHLLGVILAARKHQVRGVGLPSALLTVKKDALLAQLAHLSQRSEEQVARVISYLTYGHETKSPDPALQPIFELAEDVLVISPSLVVASNMERNFLALQARVEKAVFDAQSDVFEDRQIAEIEAAFAERGFTCKTNVKIPAATIGNDEEIDLLFADVETRTIVVGECRWTLEPADPREVFNKGDAIIRVRLAA